MSADNSVVREIEYVSMIRQTQGIITRRSLLKLSAGTISLLRQQLSARTLCFTVFLLWGAWKRRVELPLRSQIQFDNRQAHSGVDFVLHNGTTPDKPEIDSVLGGVALFDYDNDGYLDIFFTNGGTIPGFSKDDPNFFNRLYRNNHDGTFTDVTVKAGLCGEGYSMGVAAGDFNNDGWTDLYITGYNRNILYRNNGNGNLHRCDGTCGSPRDKAGWEEIVVHCSCMVRLRQ